MSTISAANEPRHAPPRAAARRRLVRTTGVRAFRAAVVAYATGSGASPDRRMAAADVAAARDRLVVVPTRAAAAQLLRSIEDARFGRDPDGGPEALVLPDFVTPGELVPALARRLAFDEPVLTTAEREVLLGVACRGAAAAGAPPPFRLRPGLVAEILRFYDELRRYEKDVDTFERLTLGRLEPGALDDRGAERLVRQTRFLVAAFRAFEPACAAAGLDEHALRQRLRTTAAERPYREIVLTVRDRAGDPHGLWPADWDLLSRLPGVEELTVIVTDGTLAGTLHERLHQLLPGIDEVRWEDADTTPGVLSDAGPALLVSADGAPLHVARDREEEVADFARRVKSGFGSEVAPPLDRVALVVSQPLPYVYLAREVLRAGGIVCQMFDALPLAAEPYAAAVDLVCSCVSANFARTPAIALLRSPHFQFAAAAAAADVVALDRALAEGGYLGDAEALDRLLGAWNGDGSATPRGAIRAANILAGVVGELRTLREPAPVADHLRVLLTFLDAHDQPPDTDAVLRARHLRGRAAVAGLLLSLRDAYARFDPAPVDFDEVTLLIRRHIESHTFAPRSGDRGVHVVDAASARFGGFDCVQLAGLVDGEWPERPRRNIFYSTSILRDLGWPAEADRLDGARAAFVDLLRLPASRLAVSSFALEADAIVSPSPLVDELERAALDPIESLPPPARIFDHEALAFEPVDLSPFAGDEHGWATRRVTAPTADARRFRGGTAPHHPRAFSLSALERYQDCPFKFFAADVLRLEESPEDESALTPRARGRFVHEVFEQFFRAWDARDDARPGHAFAPEDVDAARALFASVAEPLLARLPEADAALERTRLFGSAISVGIVDVVLAYEASRPVEVGERWLEYRLEGEFSLGAVDRHVPLKGVADRIDLLPGRRLRIVDYKTGSAPNPRRALQVPIYALCAAERLQQRDGEPWRVDEAAYVAFSGKRTIVPVVKAGSSDAAEPLTAARTRLLGLVDAVAEGEFPPRPHDEMMCRYCAYPSVCRKDYVGDD